MPGKRATPLQGDGSPGSMLESPSTTRNKGRGRGGGRGGGGGRGKGKGKDKKKEQSEGVSEAWVGPASNVDLADQSWANPDNETSELNHEDDGWTANSWAIPDPDDTPGWGPPVPPPDDAVNDDSGWGVPPLETEENIKDGEEAGSTSVGDWQPPEDDSIWKNASFDPPGDPEPFLGSVKITTHSTGGKKGKPYIPVTRVPEKISEDLLEERMKQIQLQNEKIRQRREHVKADEEAFGNLSATEKARKESDRKIQQQVNESRELNAKRKLQKIGARAWDKGKQEPGWDPELSENEGEVEREREGGKDRERERGKKGNKGHAQKHKDRATTAEGSSKDVGSPEKESKSIESDTPKEVITPRAWIEEGADRASENPTGPPHEAVIAEADKNTLGLDVTSEPGATTGHGDITHQVDRESSNLE